MFRDAKPQLAETHQAQGDKSASCTNVLLLWFRPVLNTGLAQRHTRVENGSGSLCLRLVAMRFSAKSRNFGNIP